MSKNISNLSGRIGLKKIYLKKISERYFKSIDQEILKKLQKNITWVFQLLHGAESFYEFLRPSHREKKAFVCNGSACMCAGTQEPLKET